MKLKILSERVSHRAVCVISGQSGKPYAFKRDDAARFYVYEPDSRTPAEMQEVLDDLLATSEADVSICLTEEIFFALKGESRRPVGEWAPPEYQELDKTGLIALCESVAIPFDNRVSEESLRDRLDTYFKGQADFYRQFALPSLTESFSKSKDEDSLEDSLEDAQEVDKEAADAIKETLASFQNKKELLAYVQEQCGVTLSDTLKRGVLEEAALPLLLKAASRDKDNPEEANGEDSQ